MIFGIIIISIIVIIATIQVAQFCAYERTLQGYWRAPDRFCHASGLSNAQIYIQKAQLYVYMDDPSGILCNEPVRLSMRPNPSFSTVEWSCAIPSGTGIPLPVEFTARFHPEGGMLGFYKDDVLYLELYKDSMASSMVA